MAPKNTKKWALVILVILALSGGAALWVSQQHSGGHIAKIYLNEKVIRTIDLDAVKKPYTFRVDCGDGAYNDIRVSHGVIRIVKAHCPDQVCVHQGAIKDGVAPIVCLPHRLLIKIDGETVAKHDHGDHDHDHSGTDDHSDLDAVTK